MKREEMDGNFSSCQISAMLHFPSSKEPSIMPFTEKILMPVWEGGVRGGRLLFLAQHLRSNEYVRDADRTDFFSAVEKWKRSPNDFLMSRQWKEAGKGWLVGWLQLIHRLLLLLLFS